MNSYQNLEDSVFNVLEGLFPDWRLIFAYYNDESPLSPYCSIDVQEIKMIGREYQSSLATPISADIATSVTIQDNMADVSFKFIGLQDHNTETSEMVNLLQLMLRTPKGYQLLAANNLALHGVTKFPRSAQKRDTDTYMVYELVCKFAFSNVIVSEIDWIETVELQGQYDGAIAEFEPIIVTQ